jgi:N-acetylmuramoyl-L-alanine amidase
VRLGAALALLLLPSIPALAKAHKSEAWARKQFAVAERTREALNGRPAKDRTRRQYQQAINSYRAVYYGSPTSTKADPSVVAVAELMVEMGHRFDDDAVLRAAIGQYQFLRREYPGSKYRCDALFTIGEIYKDDLNDRAKAKATFEDFVKRYPRNHLADEARDALNEPAREASGKGSKAAAAMKAAAKSEKSRQPNDADSDGSDVADTDNSSAATDSHNGAPARITSIRHWSTPEYTRVAIDLEQDIKFDSQRLAHPDRIFFDLYDTKLASTLVGKTFDVDDGFLKKIRVAQFKPGKTRLVLEVDDLSDYEAFLLPNPTRLIIDIHSKQDAKAAEIRKETKNAEAAAVAEGKPAEPAKIVNEVAEARADKIATAGEAKKPAITVTTAHGVKKTVVDADDEADDDAPDTSTVAKLDPPVTKVAAKPGPVEIAPAKSRSSKAKKNPPVDLDIREAQPTASGDRSLIRALGLKIGKIVIDAGHGGHDTGTIGPNGLLEKDLVLDVAQRLGKQLERLGAEVVYTRNDDTFIPLETRTAIANQEQADLFVSIHANASRDPDARGVETYYLNFTSSSEALEVAARENAVSDKSIHELQDLVKKIALREKIDESREFASDVQHALHTGLSVKNPGLRDRGVKKAPFIVLIGANMPSILAEISFVSNPADERKLETPEYRQKIATSLYEGISKYVGGLSGVKVASKIDKTEGQ